MQIEFHPGDDLSLILVSDDAEAESWLVETVDDQGVRQICERIASGTWVSSHRQIALGEIAWDVGLQAMEPKGKRVMISQGATILQDIPHPGSFEDDSLDGAFDGLI